MKNTDLRTLLDTIINDFYQPTLWKYRNYHITGEYQLLPDNPEYEKIQIIISSMNIIEDYLGMEKTNLSEDIDNFTKEV